MEATGLSCNLPHKGLREASAVVDDGGYGFPGAGCEGSMQRS